jgi:hypothetical protein
MKALRLTKVMLNALDPTDVAMSLRKDDREAWITLQIALSTVESYLAEAAVQQRRFVREQKAIGRYLRLMALECRTGQDRSLPRPRRRRNQFRSVHLYLTCWRMIGRHLDLISRTCGLPEVKGALRPHRDTFKRYTDMRDHYEHFDERLPGQRNVHRLAVKNDLGNFEGYVLTFGGKKVNVGPESLALLKRIISEVLLALKFGAIQALSAKNPDALTRLFMPLRMKHLNREIRKRVQALKK